jgi:hypothetical protein
MPDDALRPDAPLYERDFALWAEAQARALAGGRADALDWANLAEEIESLGRSQKREIASRLSVLLAHLLKWAFQPEQRKYGWRATIAEQRGALDDLIETSPSLRGYPETVFDKAWRSALNKAVLDTDLPPSTFPPSCPWTLEQTLDDAFFPGPPGGPA